MANTATYHHPPVHQFPPAADCTDDDLLDIAARTIAGAGHELASAPAHQLALCQLIERQNLANQQQRDQLQALTLELEAARADSALTAAMNRTSAHLGKTMAEAEADEEQRIEDAAEADRYRRVAVRYMARLREQAAEYTLDDETVVVSAELFV